jgi:hypothetical protein
MAWGFYDMHTYSVIKWDLLCLVSNIKMREIRLYTGFIFTAARAR